MKETYQLIHPGSYEERGKHRADQTVRLRQSESNPSDPLSYQDWVRELHHRSKTHDVEALYRMVKTRFRSWTWQQVIVRTSQLVEHGREFRQ